MSSVNIQAPAAVAGASNLAKLGILARLILAIVAPLP